MSACTALCLCVVALSGIWLIARKQQRWSRFFHKLPQEKFYNHYHSALGRWALVPIFIIALTGVYMMLETVGVFPKFKAEHNYDVSTLQETPAKPAKDFPVFQVPLPPLLTKAWHIWCAPCTSAKGITFGQPHCCSRVWHCCSSSTLALR